MLLAPARAPRPPRTPASPASLGERLLHLVPRERRGDGRALARAQRVDADRGLVLVVLAPVDEAPCPCAAPSSSLDTTSFGCSLLEVLGERLGERLRLVVGRLGVVQRHVDLHALRARGLGKRLQLRAAPSASRSSSATSQHSTIAAGAPGSRSKASIVGRSIGLGPRQRGVQLEVGEVGHPDQRRQVLAEAEVDRLRAGRRIAAVWTQSGGAWGSASRRRTCRPRRSGSA